MQDRSSAFTPTKLTAEARRLMGLARRDDVAEMEGKAFRDARQFAIRLKCEVDRSSTGRLRNPEDLSSRSPVMIPTSLT